MKSYSFTYATLLGASFVATILLIAVSFAQSALAHGAGISFTATTTLGYVDVDYNGYAVESGSAGFFSFHLFKDAERTEPIDFTQAWVRIAREDGARTGTTVFSGWLARPFIGSTGLSFEFAESGTYTIHVRYSNDDTEVAEAALPILVEPGVRERAFQLSIEFWSGIAGGLFLSLLVVALIVIRKRISIESS